MTMAIGFRIRDGIVLCADSQEGDGYRKRNVDKTATMLYMTPECWGVGFVGAGEILDKFFEDAIREIQKSDGRYDIKKIERAIERILGTYKKRFKDNALRILVGVFNRNRRETLLFRSDGVALVPIYDYAEVGLGGTLWEFLASNFYDEDMSCEECAALGAFILKVSGEFADCVGGPTHIMTYTKGDGLWHHPTQREVAEMKSRMPLSELEALLRRYWRSRHKFRRWNEPKRSTSRT